MNYWPLPPSFSLTSFISLLSSFLSFQIIYPPDPYRHTREVSIRKTVVEVLLEDRIRHKDQLAIALEIVGDEAQGRAHPNVRGELDLDEVDG